MFQSPQWAAGTSPGQSLFPAAVAAFSDGSVVITGSLSGTATVGASTLVAVGTDDLFVAKYDSQGTLEWATQAGDKGALGEGLGVVALADGSSIVSGVFENSATFGRGEANQTNLQVAPGGLETFVAHYGADGSLLWLQQTNSAGSPWSSAMAAAPDPISGGVVVAGTIVSSGPAATVTFGQGTASSTSLACPAGATAIFTATYGPLGNLVSARNVGVSSSVGSVAAYWVTTYSDGGCAIAGPCIGDVTFGATGNLVTLSSPSSTAGFVARYDASGQASWANLLSSTSTTSFAVTALPDGGCVVVGSFVGALSVGATTIPSAGGGFESDAFVVRYDGTGALVWANSAGSTDGASSTVATAVVALADGSVAVTGNFTAPAIFGSSTLNLAGPASDAFFAHYAMDGSLASVTDVASIPSLGPYAGQPTGVALASDGSLLVTGQLALSGGQNIVLGDYQVP